jgi:hypothetical protein
MYRILLLAHYLDLWLCHVVEHLKSTCYSRRGSSRLSYGRRFELSVDGGGKYSHFRHGKTRKVLVAQ